MAMGLIKEYYLRASDFDVNSRLMPQCVLEIFQDIAGAHAEQLGLGFDSLYEKNLIWVVVRTKYETLKSATKYSTVKVKTWPLESGGLVFRRDYLITDYDDNVLIRGSSDWMLVNSESRKLETNKNIYPENEEFCRDLAIDGKIRKLREYKGETTCYKVTPRYTDIDVNGHVNNTKYAKFVLDAINPEKGEIKEFQIDYHKEVLKGQPLEIYTGFEDNTAFSKGVCDSEKMFSCEIRFS